MKNESILVYKLKKQGLGQSGSLHSKYCLLGVFDSTKLYSVCYELTKLGTVVALRVYM